MIDYKIFTKAVIAANKQLYEYINTHITQNDFNESSTIVFGGDNSLNIDIIAENFFIKHLSKFGDIFSEEAGQISNNKKMRIIIDPLDGSDNFASGLEYYASSVALEKDGEIIAGYVCNLITGLLIYREDENIKKVNILNNKFYETYENPNPKIAIFERSYAYAEIAKILQEYSIKYRSPGAVALSLANARNYKFVLFIGKMRDFDIAAALYINKDLHIYKNEEFLIITKNFNNLMLIKEILKLI